MRNKIVTKLIIIFIAGILVSADLLYNNTYVVVGTGVTVCYNNTSVITCPTDPGAPFYGQNQGLTPSYQDNNDGTITDLNTGLMWIKERGEKMSWDSTFLMAAQCNTVGYTDWRVPSIKELYSLIDFNGKSGTTSNHCIPYIDTHYFGWATGETLIGERVIDAQDWSSTKYKAFTMINDSTIFGVNFVDGRIKGYPQYRPGTGNTVKQRLYVRFVRGNSNYGLNNFIDNGDSTLTDNSTGLMWTKNDSKYGMNWQNALSYAQVKNSTNYLGYNDWRLPTAKELQSIVDYTRCKDFTNSAAIDSIFNMTSILDEGGNLNWPFFWSNTTHKDNYGGVYVAFGEALGWLKIPPNSMYYTLFDVHGAGAQRSDPKYGNVTSYFLGLDINGNPVYGLGPQGDVIRINNFVRLVRTVSSTGIKNLGGEIPSSYSLGQNFPNPFNSSTNIGFEILEYSHVELTIFDLLGKVITTIVSKELGAGKYIVNWNADNYSSGLYFYRIRVNNFIDTKRMLLIK